MLVLVRAAISSMRAPLRPLVENSLVATSRMFARVFSAFFARERRAAPALSRIIAQSAPLLHVTPIDENDPAIADKVKLPVTIVKTK